MPTKLTTEEFIKRGNTIHNSKYDYSKVKYNGFYEKVCIICPEHGKFWQTPNCHLRGKGCPNCSAFSLKTNENFIKQAKEKHNDKYDYSKVEYANNHTKVCIICPEHGEFWQTPSSHLNGHGCPMCAVEKRKELQKIPLSEFVKKANEIHNCKYDYSKVNYECIKDKVEIICPEHGSFMQMAQDHLNGHGCTKCNSFWKSTEQFIKDAIKIHGDRYDYSKVKYKNKYSNVTIICKKHGEFKQIAQNHLKGCNCPKCTCSKIEDEVMRFLNKNNILFEHRMQFEWLGKKHLDFYLPDYNIAIECQGIEHFEPHDFFGGIYDFKKTIIRDKEKKKLCNDNKVKLVYYTNLKKYTTFLNEALIKNEKDLIDRIIVTEKEK